MALAVADRYDPSLGQALAEQVVMEGGQAVQAPQDKKLAEIKTGEQQEPTKVQNAREQAQKATQPE